MLGERPKTAEELNAELYEKVSTIDDYLNGFADFDPLLDWKFRPVCGCEIEGMEEFRFNVKHNNLFGNKEDVKRARMYNEEAKLLGKYNINTAEELSSFTEGLSNKFKELAYKRAKLRNKLRRMHDTETMQPIKDEMLVSIPYQALTTFVSSSTCRAALISIR